MQIQPDRFFNNLLSWLDLEAEAERERIAERSRSAAGSGAEQRGDTILDLVVSDSRSSLGGLTLLTLSKRKQRPLPWTRLKAGAAVILTGPVGDQTESISGVVRRVSQEEIQVATERWPLADIIRIDASPDEVTRRRHCKAIETVRAASGRVGKLRDVLLGEVPARFHDQVAAEVRGELNESQREAIAFALSARDVAIIHGPPGTGKTTTVAELILTAATAGEKIFACAPSNTATDNLLLRLVHRGHRVVRLGHPARVHDDLQLHTLDALAADDPSTRIIEEMRKEADDLFRAAGRYTRSQPPRGHKQSLRADAKRLLGDARVLERQIIRDLLDQAEIICATTTFDPGLLEDITFDSVVIDEACQSTEPGCWHAISRGQRVILAGDHCQLPPTVISQQAADEGFSTSMMQRLVESGGDEITRRLSVQYRMNESIMGFSSQQFYDGSLIADDSVSSHRLCDLPTCHIPEETDEPVMFYDTAGAGWEEELEPDGESKCNPQEAAWVAKKVESLVASGVGARDIGVIAPYAAQVRLLRRQRLSGIEIDTVDGFQGREKEAIVVSLVRANSTGEIGFLGDTRRMNVALTRARRKLILVGDSATIGGHTFYRELLDYVESCGGYHSVWEEMD